MKAAIVILNWNGKDLMRRFLPSVICNSNVQDVEVIVADNGSSDDSLEILAEEFPQVPLIPLDKNYGFAEGYNRALKQIDADYYVLLNSDVEIKQNQWILPLIQFMDENPDVAACQPKVLSAKHPQCFEYAGAAGGFVDKYGYPFCRGRIMNVVENDNSQYDNAIDVMWATGAAMIVRKNDYWKVGGLDELFFAHMEEIDLCWRMRALGKRIVCVPSVEVYHLGGASLNQGNPRKTFLNFRNNLFMLYKNLEQNDLCSVLRMRWILDNLAAISFLIKGDLANFKAVRKARKEFKKTKKKLDGQRSEIQNNRVGDGKGDRMPFSIIWQYYFKRRKHFSKLPI